MCPQVAICFHLGYNQRFDQFTPYIDNVLQSCPTADIYITYRENEDPSAMCLQKYPQAVIFRALNGCDTGAFLLQMKYMFDTHKTYDYVFKIHTKSNNPLYPHWMNDLLDPIAGTVACVNRIFKIFERHSHTGMIAGRKWILEKRN